MNPEFLLNHFDRISEAPNALPRLRRFVLDLAVRGKLMEQDPLDELAVDFLNRIQLWKAGLIKKGGVKSPERGDFTAEIREARLKDTARPFDIPSNWVWAQMGQILISRDGERIPVSREERNGRAKTYDYYGASGVIDKIDGYLFEKPLLLIGEDGANLVNRSTPIAFIARGKYWVNNHAHVLDGISEKFLQFIELYINAIDLRPYVTGTAQPKMNQAKMNSILVALPPEGEQIRIVAKVDQLMALCDQMEAHQREREAQRDRLTTAALHHLSNGATAEAFRDHALFFINHLPQFTIGPDQVPALRKAILSLAVQGKLVPHSPDHEHAPTTTSISLRRVRIRGMQDNLADEPWPNELPGSWRWHRLETISEQITDGEHATPPRIDEHQVPLVTAKNVRDGCMDYGNTDWVSYETAAKAWRRCRPSVGDLLLVCVGATTGRLCVLREPRDMVLVRSVALIRPTKAIQVDYLALVLRSPLSQKQIWEKVKVTAQPCLYINRINSLSIPVPPFDEQSCIVAKVGELMAICDRLEALLTTAQTENSLLLESVLYHALHECLQRVPILLPDRTTFSVA